LKLKKEIAQSIVSRTMKLIQYNINIMDERGIIIGSGDPSRIGSYHHGAFRVFEENKVIEIRKGSVDFQKVAKEGVNLPIRFNEQPVGVVGITGQPDEVRIHGAMVQAMAELMLEEAFYWEQENIVEQARFSLISDLIYGAPGLKEEIFLTRSGMLGFTLNLPRVVVVFELQKNIPAGESTTTEAEKAVADNKSRKINKQIEGCLSLSKEDLFAAGIGGKYILIKNVEATNPEVIKSSIIWQLNKLEDLQYTVSAGIGGLSNSYEQLNESFRQALQALEVGHRLYGNNKILSTEDLGLESFVDLVGIEFRCSFSSKILVNLKTVSSGNDQQLIETAIAYLDHDMQSGATSRSLFIHRNTLTYRLDRIKALTGLDLRTVNDALKFKLAIMCLQYDRPLL
jgi:carbohydrate diacid regulator